MAQTFNIPAQNLSFTIPEDGEVFKGSDGAIYKRVGSKIVGMTKPDGNTANTGYAQDQGVNVSNLKTYNTADIKSAFERIFNRPNQFPHESSNDVATFKTAQPEPTNKVFTQRPNAANPHDFDVVDEGGTVVRAAPPAPTVPGQTPTDQTLPRGRAPAEVMNASNLFEFYQAMGQSLPPVSERAKLFKSVTGRDGYTGTVEQNQLLLPILQGIIDTGGTVTGSTFTQGVPDAGGAPTAAPSAPPAGDTGGGGAPSLPPAGGTGGTGGTGGGGTGGGGTGGGGTGGGGTGGGGTGGGGTGGGGTGGGGTGAATGGGTGGGAPELPEAPVGGTSGLPEAPDLQAQKDNLPSPPAITPPPPAPIFGKPPDPPEFLRGAPELPPRQPLPTAPDTGVGEVPQAPSGERSVDFQSILDDINQQAQQSQETEAESLEVAGIDIRDSSAIASKLEELLSDVEKPEPVSLVDEFKQQRAELGIGDLEGELSSLDAEIASLDAEFATTTEEEEGRRVSLGAIRRRQSALGVEYNRQRRDLLVEKQILTTQLNNKYGVLNTIITLTGQDFQNAQASYQFEFGRAMDTINMFRALGNDQFQRQQHADLQKQRSIQNKLALAQFESNEEQRQFENEFKVFLTEKNLEQQQFQNEVQLFQLGQSQFQQEFANRMSVAQFENQLTQQQFQNELQLFTAQQGIDQQQFANALSLFQVTGNLQQQNFSNQIQLFQTQLGMDQQQFSNQLALYNAERGAADQDFQNQLALFDRQTQQQNRIQDNARANLQVTYNLMQSQGIDFSALPQQSQLEIKNLEMQAGLPTGFFEFVPTVANNTLDKMITTNQRSFGGTEFIDVVFQDQQTGEIYTQTVQAGNIDKSTNPSAPENREAAFADAQSYVADNPNASDEELFLQLRASGFTVTDANSIIGASRGNNPLTADQAKERVVTTLTPLKGSFSRAEAEVQAKAQLRQALGLGANAPLPRAYEQAVDEAIDEVYGDLNFLERTAVGVFKALTPGI